MGKFFGIFGKTPAEVKPEAEPERFSRFAQPEENQSLATDVDEKFTRFAPQGTPKRPSPTPRRVRHAAPVSAPPVPEIPAISQQVFSDVDNLNSEADIPLSVISKALPQRFSEMRDTRNLVVLS